MFMKQLVNKCKPFIKINIARGIMAVVVIGHSEELIEHSQGDTHTVDT